MLQPSRPRCNKRKEGSLLRKQRAIGGGFRHAPGSSCKSLIKHILTTTAIPEWVHAERFNDECNHSLRAADMPSLALHSLCGADDAFFGTPPPFPTFHAIFYMTEPRSSAMLGCLDSICTNIIRLKVPLCFLLSLFIMHTLPGPLLVLHPRGP